MNKIIVLLFACAAGLAWVFDQMNREETGGLLRLQEYQSERSNMQNLLRDPKFWTAVVAAVFNLVLFFVGKYAPQYVDDIKFVIGTIDPILAIVIGALFVQAQVAKMETNVKAHIESLMK